MTFENPERPERAIPIAHYGLHYDETGIAYLHQGTKNAPNFVGLKKLTPFASKPDGAKACPHNMNVSAPMPDRVHWAFFCRIFDDALLQELLPIPKQSFAQVPFVNDPNNELAMALTILSKMSSPIYNVVHPLTQLTEKQLLEKLSLTNVAPLILTGVKTSDHTYAMKLAREAQIRPRRLILTGDAGMVCRDPLVRIPTHLFNVENMELVQLPMEQLGVAIMRRHLRGEQLNAPYERREP